MKSRCAAVFVCFCSFARSRLVRSTPASTCRSPRLIRSPGRRGTGGPRRIRNRRQAANDKRPVVKVKARQPLTVQFIYQNTYPHGDIRDAGVAYFVVPVEKTNQKTVPDLKNAVDARQVHPELQTEGQGRCAGRAYDPKAGHLFCSAYSRKTPTAITSTSRRLISWWNERRQALLQLFDNRREVLVIAVGVFRLYAEQIDARLLDR